jgi:hypothetical protein
MKHLLPYPFVLLILLISNNTRAETYEVPLFMAQVESMEMAEQFDQLEKMAQDYGKPIRGLLEAIRN